MNEHEVNAKIFKALCDEKRLAILELLRDGEKCACVLSDCTDIKQSALSYHMKILCESGIVCGVQNGKWMLYRINSDVKERMIKIVDEIITPSQKQTPNETYLLNLA